MEAYLHQTLAGLVSACQRLLPLGQTRARQILSNLKTTIVNVVNSSAEDYDEVNCFTPLLDLGSMRHTTLTTRLFIS